MTAPFGVVFDMDGVLFHDYHPIAGAREAVALLMAQNVPHMFVTNGGGHLEVTKRDKLAHALSIEPAAIDVARILVPHTPFKNYVLAKNFQAGRDHVLVVGGCDDRMTTLAKSYGLPSECIVTVAQLIDVVPHIVVERKRSAAQQETFDRLGLRDATTAQTIQWPFNIRAVMIFEEPLDWQVSIQIIVDLVVGDQQRGANVLHRPPFDDADNEQMVDILHANMDLSYRGAFPHPRFTNGAFNAALEAVFERHTGRKLRVLRFGKPESSSFQHAETVLAPDPALRKTMQFYMIGDNPRSDIAGANAMGSQWRSVLVRTGNFQSTAENDAEHPAWRVCDNVGDAIAMILALHQ